MLRRFGGKNHRSYVPNGAAEAARLAEKMAKAQVPGRRPEHAQAP